MLNIEELKFDEKGLVPAVVVDSITKKVLTVADVERSVELNATPPATQPLASSKVTLSIAAANENAYFEI